MDNDPGTYRKKVALPSMPTMSNAMRQYPSLKLQKASFFDGNLQFEHERGFQQAIRHGFFLLEQPKDLDLGSSDKLAQRFFEDPLGDEDDDYRGFKSVEIPGDYQGYFDREHDQWENLYVEMKNWGRALPSDVVMVGEQMTRLGIDVLTETLKFVGVPKNIWTQVTSGLSETNGHQMLGFNHYRSDKDLRGCKFHRDSGWVTVLRTVHRGLLALIDDVLYAIDPCEGYFIVNYGSSFEVLTQRMENPVRANIHGVCQTEITDNDTTERTSYVVFLDSNLDGTIFQLENGKAKEMQSVREFAIQEVSRTYDDDVML